MRAVVALVLFCSALLAIVGGAGWLIATSENPLGYSVLAALGVAVVWVFLEGPPSEDSWRAGVLIWMFAPYDD